MKVDSHLSQLGAQTVSVTDDQDGTQLMQAPPGTKEMTATGRSRDRSPFSLDRSDGTAAQTEQHCMATIQTP